MTLLYIQGECKKFGDWEHKANKNKHGNKIPSITLKVTSVGYNVLMTSLIKLLE